MDSFTQVVLGAAMGELAAGRKIGNRAMIWGAVAGTVPDLDIVANFVADPITSLAFHRCVTHSIYYALLASPILAWMARSLYGAEGRPQAGYLWRVWLPGIVAISALIVMGSAISPTPLIGIWGYSLAVAAATCTYPLIVWAFRSIKARDPDTSQTDYKHWLWLFLLGIGTHPLLDCFTTYGTQILQPFDDLRVAWNTVSVVDPAYTLPFLALLLIASRMLRGSAWRRRLTWVGAGISSGYLLFTCFNLWRIRSQVADDLAAAGITYERFLAAPTLFQNVLWSVTIDQGDTLRVGQLGLLDEPFRLSPNQLVAFSRQEELLLPIADQRAVEVAKWFSDGYYVASPGQADTINFVDLRFGILPIEGSSPVFAFQLYPRAGETEWGFRQKPFKDDVDVSSLFQALWQRVKGGHIDKSERKPEAL